MNPSWGIGNATMVITVEKNRTLEKRSAVVVVWIDEENSREITITQAAGTEAPAGERKFYVTKTGSTDNSGLYWDEPTTSKGPSKRRSQAKRSTSRPGPTPRPGS